MPSQEKLNANRKLFTELLLEQAKPFLAGKPGVWAKEFGEAQDFNDALALAAKAKFLPFGKNEMKTDCRVFLNLPSTLGEAYAVLHFHIFALQPTDYIFIFNQNIPGAAFLKKAKGMELNDSWATARTENGEKDPFADYLSGLERKSGMLPDAPHYYANWKYHLGKLAVEVPYTMVLMPLGDGRTAFLFKYNYSPGLFSVKKSNFNLDKVWYLAEWVRDALTEYAYDGEPAPLEVPIGAVSLLALPEIAPMFEYPGRDIDLDVDLSGYLPTKPVEPTAVPQTQEARTEKYCMSCGEVLPIKAAFCTKCGAKQD